MTQFTNFKLKMKVEFENPLLVSTEGKDRLKITFGVPWIFRSSKTKNTLAEKYTISGIIPP